jgi:hypothetical protein
MFISSLCIRLGGFCIEIICFHRVKMMILKDYNNNSCSIKICVYKSNVK